MSELTVGDVDKMGQEITDRHGHVHRTSAIFSVIALDWHRKKEELEQYKKGYWGNPCEKHENVEVWVASVVVDDEGLHCFGCFIEAYGKEKGPQR